MAPKRISYLFLLSLALPLATCQDQRVLYIMGGRSDYNPEIYSRFMEDAGGSGARVGIVSAASGTPIQSGLAYEEVFDSLGAEETYWIPVMQTNPDAAQDPEVVNKVLDMTAFYFSGGDQARIIRSLYTAGRTESPVLSAIRAMYESGQAVVGGDSAGGTVMTAAPMVLGGESWNALSYGSFEQGDNDAGSNDLTFDPDGGIGFMPAGISLDTHFTQRGREGRMIRILSDTASSSSIGSSLGIGVDEDTALRVTSDASDGSAPVGEVLGTNGVYFADVSEADVGTVNLQWSLRGARTSYLESGDVVDLVDWTDVSYPGYKSDLAGEEFYVQALTSDAIFAGDITGQPGELAYIATNLMDSKEDSTWGDTLEPLPKFRLTFTKTDETEGFGGYPDGGVGDPDFRISYSGLQVDIEAKEVGGD